MDKLPPKKSLGQNFLRSQTALAQIVEGGNIQQNDIILEIGPGKGVLTRKLLEKSNKVFVIEKDSRLIEPLTQEFETEIKSGQLVLIEGDVLKIDIDSYIPQSTHYKLIANIPYYITGEILRLFLSRTHQPEHIVLLTQKEVTDRIVAQDGKESILSLSIKVYGTPKSLGIVKKEAFTPQPKVDSKILLIKDISKKHFDIISEEFFFKIIKTGFAQKRKKLTGNLSSLFAKKDIEVLFTKLSLDLNTRAEDVPLSVWLELCKLLK
mgnify:CR=1 FL=1